MSQTEVIRQILARAERVVTVGNAQLRLQVPALPDALAIRERVFEATALRGERGEGDDIDEAEVRAWTDLSVAAIAACLEGVDEETAGRLLLAAGDDSELAHEAVRLCLRLEPTEAGEAGEEGAQTDEDPT